MELNTLLFFKRKANMTKHKITPEQKQAVADLLGIEVDKIPGEVDWDETETEEDDDEDLDEEDENDEDDETLEDDEDEDEEPELDDDEDEDEDDDEDKDAEDDESIRVALIEYENTDKSIPFSDFLKNKGL